uniref:G-protein coupled receptors family 1 profile domain-containing protein n=1 Tax=Sander lucioperca TaxID=283035 RepID=A0A8C9XTN5_SANLU
ASEVKVNISSEHRSVLGLYVLFLLLPVPIFAIMGNLVIMAAVAHFRSLQTPTNAFVVSLAVTDFLVAVLVMPFSLGHSVDSWHFRRFFCRAHFLLDITFCTCSIFNLSCVALDRNNKRVAILLLLCWILPLVISSLCVYLGMYTQSPPAVVSSSKQDTQTCLAMFYVPNAFATSAISFFIPMGFMLFAYGKIFKAAQRQARWIHAIAYLERYSLKKERKAAKTLGLIIGVFLFCWLPFFCVTVVHSLKGYSVSPLVLEASMWLEYANSSLNPFLYALFNMNYRHVFAAMLDCGILRRPLRASLDSSLCGRQSVIIVY